MSIAEDEARERFKDEWQEDMREVYVLGRTATPSDAEVEAVAKHLMWADEIPRWEKTYGEAPDEDFFWKRAETVGARDGYLTLAKELLEIARNAVSE